MFAGFLADGKLLTAHLDGKLRIWHPMPDHKANFTLTTEWYVDPNAVYGLVLVGPHHLVTCGSDKTIKCWNIRSKKQETHFAAHTHIDFIQNVAFMSPTIINSVLQSQSLHEHVSTSARSMSRSQSQHSLYSSQSSPTRTASSSRSPTRFGTRVLNRSNSSREDLSKTFHRLSLPKQPSKQLSGSMSDLKECTFSPVLSKQTKALVDHSSTFSTRLKTYQEKYHEKRVREPPVEHTFKPELKYGKLAQKYREGLESSDFLDRMSQDFSKRKTNEKNATSQESYTFQPELSSTSKKISSKIDTSFLDRLEDDIRERTTNRKSMEQEVLRGADYSFHPKTNARGDGDFLGRMVKDLETRFDKSW